MSNLIWSGSPARSATHPGNLLIKMPMSWFYFGPVIASGESTYVVAYWRRGKTSATAWWERL